MGFFKLFSSKTYVVSRYNIREPWEPRQLWKKKWEKKNAQKNCVKNDSEKNALKNANAVKNKKKAIHQLSKKEKKEVQLHRYYCNHRDCIYWNSTNAMSLASNMESHWVDHHDYSKNKDDNFCKFCGNSCFEGDVECDSFVKNCPRVRDNKKGTETTRAEFFDWLYKLHQKEKKKLEDEPPEAEAEDEPESGR